MIYLLAFTNMLSFLGVTLVSLCAIWASVLAITQSSLVLVGYVDAGFYTSAISIINILLNILDAHKSA